MKVGREKAVKELRAIVREIKVLSGRPRSRACAGADVCTGD
jgi:hypothetical protein